MSVCWSFLFALQVSQMAVPYWVPPTHTALPEIQHSFPFTPTPQNNVTIWMLQVWTDSWNIPTVDSLPGADSLFSHSAEHCHSHCWLTFTAGGKSFYTTCFGHFRKGNLAFQLWTAKSTCLLQAFYYANVELLGKITNQCVNSVDLIIKLRIHELLLNNRFQGPSDEQTKGLCLPWVSASSRNSFSLLLLSPKTFAVSCRRPLYVNPFWPTGFSIRRVPTVPFWHSGQDKTAESLLVRNEITSFIWVNWNLGFLLPIHLYFFMVLRQKLAIPAYRYSLNSWIIEPDI